MRLTDYDKLQLKLRAYADKKAANGEIEITNNEKLSTKNERNRVYGKRLMDIINITYGIMLRSTL